MDRALTTATAVFNRVFSRLMRTKTHVFLIHSDFIDIRRQWDDFQSDCFSEKKSEKKCSPNVGLEPTTLRLRVSCSTDWASRAAYGALLLLSVLIRKPKKIQRSVLKYKRVCNAYREEDAGTVVLEKNPDPFWRKPKIVRMYELY